MPEKWQQLFGCRKNRCRKNRCRKNRCRKNGCRKNRYRNCGYGKGGTPWIADRNMIYM
jgi:hypothetical protein